jgi:hypothetical protein
MPEEKAIRQKVFTDNKTFTVTSANQRITIDLQTNKEYKKVIGIFFQSSNQSMKKSRIDLNIDQEIVFKNALIEAHTIHTTEEARTYKGVKFNTTIKADGSTIEGIIQCDNLAVGDIIDMCLICEK